MEARREIKISTRLQVQKPPLSTNSGRFYKIYSPEKIELRPCDSKILNLHLKAKLPEGIQGFISLLPIFIEQSLTLENSKPITSQKCNEPIKIELLNRNFHCTTQSIKMKK